jgi:hypothetical protein
MQSFTVSPALQREVARSSQLLVEVLPVVRSGRSTCLWRWLFALENWVVFLQANFWEYFLT